MVLTSRIDTDVTRWQRVNWLAQEAGQLDNYSPQQFYTMQNHYYQNNGLYLWLMYNLYNEGIIYEGMMPLRNPAFRVVEFYVAKLWAGQLPDALPIETKNKKIIPAIEQVWVWSNWDSEKQVAARLLAKHGDWFCKVATRSSNREATGFDRVFFQNIYPGNVTDFDVDDRGVVTWIRMDTVKATRQPNGEIETVNRTEVWDADQQLLRIWEHDKDAGTQLDRLGSIPQETPFSEYGIDFIPIVHSKFRDIGDKRGMGSFDHALDKIDEANRQATRLHQMLFRHNKNTWVVEKPGMDATGRPLPPPKVGGQLGSSSRNQTDDQSITVGDEEFFTVPGNAIMKSLVPSIAYGDALQILQAQVAELEKDLPELAYYRLREMNQISGIAAQYLLGDAIDKVIEARGNAETALARLNAMALTIGQAGGLEGFSKDKIGTYEGGGFEHIFTERPVIALSEEDRATIIKGYTGAGVPLVTAARRAGFSEDEIKQMLKDKAEQTERNTANLANAFLARERDSRQGDNPANQLPGNQQQGNQQPEQEQEE